jgi:hypothetical protein
MKKRRRRTVFSKIAGFTSRALPASFVPYPTHLFQGV